MIWIIGHILALCIGLSLGLIGGGGSILAVPILVYVMGLEAKTAIAMSLAIVGVVSLIGVIPHWQQGNVNLKTAINFTPPAMFGAFLGARIAAWPFVTNTLQLVCFAVMMLIASYFMIRKPQEILGEHVELSVPEKERLKYPWLAINRRRIGSRHTNWLRGGRWRLCHYSCFSLAGQNTDEGGNWYVITYYYLQIGDGFYGVLESSKH